MIREKNHGKVDGPFLIHASDILLRTQVTSLTNEVAKVAHLDDEDDDEPRGALSDVEKNLVDTEVAKWETLLNQ